MQRFVSEFVKDSRRIGQAAAFKYYYTCIQAGEMILQHSPDAYDLPTRDCQQINGCRMGASGSESSRHAPVELSSATPSETFLLRLMSNLPWSLSLALWFGVGCWGCGRQSVDPRQASNHAQHTSALSPGQSQPPTPEAGRLFHTSGCASSFNPPPISRCLTSGLQEALFSHVANRCKSPGLAQSRGLAPLVLPISGGSSVPGRQCSMQWRAVVVSAASSHSPNFPIHVALPIVFL